MKEFNKKIISEKLNTKIKDVIPLSGGFIAKSYCVITNTNKLFVKIDSHERINCEANSLIELKKSKKVKVPEIYFHENNLLATEWIDTCNSPIDTSNLAHSLASLHAQTFDNFGFTENNFIGSTPQFNKGYENNWAEFFWHNRLEKQLKFAEKYFQLDENIHQNLKETTFNFLKDIKKSSLIHGDLWSGNILLDSNRNATLIDPSVSYSHFELEFGLIELFGGLSEKFYKQYCEILPIEDDFCSRLNLYKLYHLLNHLNIFGVQYLSDSKNLIDFILMN